MSHTLKIILCNSLVWRRQAAAAVSAMFRLGHHAHHAPAVRPVVAATPSMEPLPPEPVQSEAMERVDFSRVMGSYGYFILVYLV